MKACGAKTRGGGSCKRQPVKGKTRCRLHGGATPSGPDSANYKHGRYSKAFHGTMSIHFVEAQEEAAPLDLMQELAVQRAVLSHYVDAVSSKPKQEPEELRMIGALAEDVVKTAASISRMRNDTALTIAEIKFLQQGMMRLIEKYVPDVDKRRSFIEELSRIVPGGDDARADEPETVPVLAGAASQAA